MKLNCQEAAMFNLWSKAMPLPNPLNPEMLSNRHLKNKNKKCQFKRSYVKD